MTQSLGSTIGVGIPTGVAMGRRQRHCPGAVLRLTVDDYAAMKRGGEVFSTAPQEIRHVGRSDARVLCRRDVAEIKVVEYERPDDKKTVATVYDAALCSSCAELEKINRAQLGSQESR
jgi:hypothetical protein